MSLSDVPDDPSSPLRPSTVTDGVERDGPDLAVGPSDSDRRASLRVWDGLSEDERRRQLDELDPDALRALTVSMQVIEQAKGILMGCHGYDAAAAFQVLRRASSSRNVKLRVLAAAVVAAVSSPTSPAEAAASPAARVRRALHDTPGSAPLPPLPTTSETPPCVRASGLVSSVVPYSGRDAGA